MHIHNTQMCKCIKFDGSNIFQELLTQMWKRTNVAAKYLGYFQNYSRTNAKYIDAYVYKIWSF